MRAAHTRGCEPYVFSAVLADARRSVNRPVIKLVADFSELPDDPGAPAMGARRILCQNRVDQFAVRAAKLRLHLEQMNPVVLDPLIGGRFVPEFQLLPEPVGVHEELERIIEVAACICQNTRSHDEYSQTIGATVVRPCLLEASSCLCQSACPDEKERLVAEKIAFDPLHVVRTAGSSPLTVAEHIGFADKQLRQGAQKPVLLFFHVLEFKSAGPDDPQCPTPFARIDEHIDVVERDLLRIDGPFHRYPPWRR